MRIYLQSALALCLAWPATAGDLTGQVIITKRLTKRAVAPVAYNLRGVATPAAPAVDLLNELDRTVIMLEGGKVSPARPQTITIEQKNSRFEPDLAILPVGSSVEFPNQDPIFHNVFSLSKSQPFDLGFFPKGQSRTVKFEHAGVVQVYCHIHANMYAAIVVTDSHWYGKPSSDGSFTWNNIPSGHYKVVAWHKIAGLYQAEVDVPETGRAEVRINVPVDTERR
jgi:plastocyanin